MIARCALCFESDVECREALYVGEEVWTLCLRCCKRAHDAEWDVFWNGKDLVPTETWASVVFEGA